MGYLPGRFHNSWNGANDFKGPENINYTIVKYEDMFYGHHTTAAVKINIFLK